jgi:hypothetical protein
MQHRAGSAYRSVGSITWQKGWIMLLDLRKLVKGDTQGFVVNGGSHLARRLALPHCGRMRPRRLLEKSTQCSCSVLLRSPRLAITLLLEPAAF